MLGQRYAFDLVRIDDRKGFHLHPAGALRSYLIGGRTRDCYGWGRPVHATFDGEVVEAVDRVPERAWLHVIRELALVLKNAVSFDPRKRGLNPILGNHVIVRAGETYALFAHLAPGTVTVRTGETIGAGHVIGRVGHTGNSTAPHLHFQLMDSADLLKAEGIPCAFAEYLMERGGRWVRVERGIPGERDRIRSRQWVPPPPLRRRPGSRARPPMTGSRRSPPGRSAHRQEPRGRTRGRRPAP
jgi:murein DD-endopeptidase MepM/ murein hydrolase activator NlpD